MGLLWWEVTILIHGLPQFQAKGTLPVPATTL